VRVVELDDPKAAAAAVADLVGGPDPEPIEHWDAQRFADALDAVLPAAPRLA